jgi:hypothetical protein
MSTVNDSVSVVAWKGQNSKSKVFKERNDRLKSKLPKLLTVASTPKIAGPSPAMSGKAFWKYMGTVLTKEELREAKKEHQHQRYLAEKLAKGGCVNNVLTSPPSPPESVAGPSPAVSGKAYWKYMGTVLTEEELKEAKKEHRHHKRHYKYLEKNPKSSSSPMSLSKAFWKRMREGSRTQEEFEVKRRKIINLKRMLQRNTNGSLLRFEREPSRTSPDSRLDFVPAVVVRQMSKYLLGCLQDVERRVAEVLLSSPVKSAHRRAGNHAGTSLGLTVAPGGPYATDGWSGSIHLNRGLKSHAALQEEVIELVIDIILESYGDELWFIELMRCLGDIPDAAFLPGSRKIPASSIWWSHSPDYHVHCDTNSLGAVFVFAAVAVAGCELVIDRPFCGGYQVTKHHLSEGKIIGGSWGQYSHFNLPVLDSTIPRRSWVVYLDYRTICASYRNMVPPKPNSKSATTRVSSKK